MDRHNALRLNARVFDPATVTDASKAFNQEIMNQMAQTPNWYEVRSHFKSKSSVELLQAQAHLTVTKLTWPIYRLGRKDIGRCE